MFKSNYMSKNPSTLVLDQIKAVNGFDSEGFICVSLTFDPCSPAVALLMFISSRLRWPVIVHSQPFIIFCASWLTTGVPRDLHLHPLRAPDSARVMSVRLLLVLVSCPCAEDVPPLMELSPGPVLSAVWIVCGGGGGSEMTGWWGGSAWWSRSIHIFSCSCPRVRLYLINYYLLFYYYVFNIIVFIHI